MDQHATPSASGTCQQIQSVDEMRALSRAAHRRGEVVVLVPTMVRRQSCLLRR